MDRCSTGVNERIGVGIQGTNFTAVHHTHFDMFGIMSLTIHYHSPWSPLAQLKSNTGPDLKYYLFFNIAKKKSNDQKKKKRNTKVIKLNILVLYKC